MLRALSRAAPDRRSVGHGGDCGSGQGGPASHEAERKCRLAALSASRRLSPCERITGCHLTLRPGGGRFLLVLLLLRMAGCGEGEGAGASDVPQASDIEAGSDTSLSLATWRQRRCPGGRCHANASHATGGGAREEGGHETKEEERVVVVATPGRVGSTLLYNAARILLQHLRPAVSAGFADLRPDREETMYPKPALETPGGWRAWRALGTSVVVKTHGFSADLCNHLDLLLTARRPVPDAVCSAAQFNAQREEVEQSNLEAMVLGVLEAGQELHREVSACPTHKVLQLRYSDLVYDLSGTIRKMADALSGVGQGGARISDEILANVERLVLLTLPPGGDAAKHLPSHAGAPTHHPITLLYPNHVRGWRNRMQNANASEGGGEPSWRLEWEKHVCARIHVVVAELAGRDPSVRAFVEWSAS